MATKRQKKVKLVGWLVMGVIAFVSAIFAPKLLAQTDKIGVLKQAREKLQENV